MSTSITGAGRRVLATAAAIALGLTGFSLPAAAQALPQAGAALTQETGAAAAIAVTKTSVEQADFFWFDLSGFTPSASVTVQLVGPSDQPVASAGFSIGTDGNTYDEDQQTYRRVEVPRNAAPGGGYALRVISTPDAAVLATSEALTVTAATRRVFNTGDHGAGEEDTGVRQGNAWTFRAVNFAAGGKLTATAWIDGTLTELGGIGQISASEKKWQLDSYGDTRTRNGSSPFYTRVSIPEGTPVGPLDVEFSDGVNTLTRTLTVEPAPEDISYQVSRTAQLGGSVRLTGTGWVHPDGVGSRIAVKINDGDLKRTPEGLIHSNNTIWAIIDAENDGSFSADIPIPDGTATGSGGSVPAIAPGSYTLRLLSGNLKAGDQSRSVETETIALGLGKAATSTAVTLSPSSPSYGSAPTATVRVSSAAGTPTGRVTLRIDGRGYQRNLSGGQARIKLTAAPRAGKRTIAVSYAGTDELAASTASRSVSVRKATPKVSLRLAKSKVKRSQRAKVTVTVPSIGALKVRATGTVQVYDGKKRIAAKKLTSSARGKVSLSLPKLKKKGAHKIRVRLVGNANLNAKASATRTLRVTG